MPIKHFDDPHGAFHSANLQLAQRGTHRVLVGEVETEQVQLVLIEMRTQFDADDDADPTLDAGGDCLG